LFDKYKEEECPREFDVNWVEENNGENCAIISVKNADLNMIKFLHTVCKADFNIKTKNNEGALQIAVAGSKRKP